jgi:2-iminoacetate synthase
LRASWTDTVIRQDEIDRYLTDGRDFVDDRLIVSLLEKNANPDPARIMSIIDKALSISTLLPEETAALLQVRDEDL